jgi:hypothetical protein
MARGEILLSQEELKALLKYDPETGEFIRLAGRMDRSVGWVDADGYLIIQIRRLKYRAHRLAIFYMTGEWPPDQVDHIDRVTSNNAYSNLRPVTAHENCWNRSSRQGATSKIIGVSWIGRRSKWAAQIISNGKKYHLGEFSSEEEAGKAYQEAKKRLHRMGSDPDLKTLSIGMSHVQRSRAITSRSDADSIGPDGLEHRDRDSPTGS